MARVVVMSDVADPRELVPAAIDRFTARVRAVGAGDWDAPTPCSAWTVRDLVAHLCFEHRWAPHVLAGETMEAVGDRYEDDLVGADAGEAWERAAGRSRPRWSATGEHAALVHVSFGWLTVGEYAEQMLLDLTVHEWDLARGAGLDEQVDARCVDRALAYLRSDPIMLTGPGLFAAPVAPRGPTAQDQLMALTGRAL
jgi:uncharacterized protein (TIGR03086 family)